ncbi:helix-turn-helix domain-containing protein [Oenococcus oeni]|uniref:helix-turn-helix domain-containing protein n=2 Tax=Oenococcus oeni TaxID=1247 RepID=UPI00050E3833|nr:XRE family transcriptional regulator [Oenococcus oeni]KGH72119.1 XRE family transcriptional regulator [Oenococcus oeni IOEB_0608]
MFADKLKKLRESQNLSLEALADILNKKYETKISKSMISRWENGSDIALSYARIIADYFKISPDEVLGFDTSNIVSLKPTHSLNLPIYSHLFAGMPDGAEEDVIGTIDVPDRIANKYGKKNLLAIKVEGDSMNKVILDGMIAVVNTDDTEVKNGNVYAVIVNGYANTLKHVYKYADHIRFEPDSFNPANKPFSYQYDEDISIKIIGKLVYIAQDLG